MAHLEIIHEKTEDNIIHLTLVGKVDTKTSSQLKSMLKEALEHQYCRVILDLSQVDFLASVGISVLIDATISFQEKGGNLIVMQPPLKVIEIFRLLNLLSFFTFAQNREEALKKLGSK
jgi:anti-sigma B factor antagonist